MRQRPSPSPRWQQRDVPDECEWRGCTNPPELEAMWLDQGEIPPRDFAYFCSSCQDRVIDRDAPTTWRAI